VDAAVLRVTDGGRVTSHESPNHDKPSPWPIASHPGARPHPARPPTILAHHGRHEPRRRGRLGPHLACTKNAQKPLEQMMIKQRGSARQLLYAHAG
jgi:hypothetical protein